MGRRIFIQALSESRPGAIRQPLNQLQKTTAISFFGWKFRIATTLFHLVAALTLCSPNKGL
jgi:hypothetical protein